MPLEDLTGTKYIDALVSTNPASGDTRTEGDDHLRGIKNVLLLSFPAITGAVTATHTELNIMDGVTSSTAELNLLTGKSLSSSNSVLDNFEGTADAGGNPTKMTFQQTTAPTGWTKETTHNNKALRVVTGTASSGGATAFTSVFGASKAAGSTTLTSAQSGVGSHGHAVRGGKTNNVIWSGGSATGFGAMDTLDGAAVVNFGDGSQAIINSSANASSGHTHSLSLDLQYVDIILAKKD